MKPGKEGIPEFGILKESQPATPEAARRENLEQAVGSFEEFARSFQPNINPADFKNNLDYRIRAAELFAKKSDEEIKKSDGRRQSDTDVRLLYGIHSLITRDLITQNTIGGRSHLTNEQNLSQLRETIEFQQNLTRFIIRNRTLPDLDAIMQRYWKAYENISYRLTNDPGIATSREYGIEHAVTASQILEERGWRTHKPSVSDDMKKGTDGYATGITPDGKEILLATQFKTNNNPLAVVSIEILYPFPSVTEIDEDAWDLVANVKEHRVKNPHIPLFPVLIRVPSSYQTQHIRKGTGLLASPQSTDALLDEKNRKALEYAEMLADLKTDKPKYRKKAIYVPQAK
ncbi:MAG: hypothetical protein AAB461_03215 [Patescibacteria group bacterium]